MDNRPNFTRCLPGATKTPLRPPDSPRSRLRPLVNSNGNPTSHAELGPLLHETAGFYLQSLWVATDLSCLLHIVPPRTHALVVIDACSVHYRLITGPFSSPVRSFAALFHCRFWLQERAVTVAQLPLTRTVLSIAFSLSKNSWRTSG